MKPIKAGSTALITAVLKGQKDAVCLLLSRGADVNKVSEVCKAHVFVAVSCVSKEKLFCHL